MNKAARQPLAVFSGRMDSPVATNIVVQGRWRNYWAGSTGSSIISVKIIVVWQRIAPVRAPGNAQPATNLASYTARHLIGSLLAFWHHEYTYSTIKITR